MFTWFCSNYKSTNFCTYNTFINPVMLDLPSGPSALVCIRVAETNRSMCMLPNKYYQSSYCSTYTFINSVMLDLSCWAKTLVGIGNGKTNRSMRMFPNNGSNNS
jgi:hypothetical protein